jgi:hydrogenase-4 membrane subunit HyfE
VPLLPPIAIGLLMFNLWFTLNRMQSLARIVAYIQLELEEKAYGPWLGWETCLRHYRKWTKLNKLSVKGIIKSKLEGDVVPGAAGYYPTIYLMHIVAVIVTSIGSLAYAIMNQGTTNLVMAIITCLLLLLFLVYASKHRPDKMRSYIEEDRIIWLEVFEDLQKRGIKS